MIRSGRETTTKIPKKSLPWRAVLGAAPLSPLGFGALGGSMVPLRGGGQGNPSPWRCPAPRRCAPPAVVVGTPMATCREGREDEVR